MFNGSRKNMAYKLFSTTFPIRTTKYEKTEYQARYFFRKCTILHFINIYPVLIIYKFEIFNSR